MRHILAANWTNRGMAVALDRMCFDRPWAKHCFDNTDIRYVYVTDVLAGYAAYRTPFGKKYIEIIRLGVKPQFRRLGVGSDLLTYLKQESHICHHLYMRALVDEREVDTCKFFAANGFRSVLLKSKQPYKPIQFEVDTTGRDTAIGRIDTPSQKPRGHLPT